MGKGLASDLVNLEKGVLKLVPYVIEFVEGIFTSNLPIPGLSEILDLFGIHLSLGDIIAFIAALINIGINEIENIMHIMKLDTQPDDTAGSMAIGAVYTLRPYNGDSVIRCILAILSGASQLALDISRQLLKGDSNAVTPVSASAPDASEVKAIDGLISINALFGTFLNLAFYPLNTTGLGGTAYFLGLIYTYLSGIIGQSIIMDKLSSGLASSFSCIIDPLKKCMGGGGNSSIDSISTLAVGSITSLLHVAAIIYTWEAPSHKDLDYDYKTFATLNHSQMVVSGISIINSAFKTPNVPALVACYIAEDALLITASVFAYKSK